MNKAWGLTPVSPASGSLRSTDRLQVQGYLGCIVSSKANLSNLVRVSLNELGRNKKLD